MVLSFSEHSGWYLAGAVVRCWPLRFQTWAWAGGRFPANQLLPYIVAQVLGAVVAGGVLYIIASGKAGYDVSAGFASNGYGTHSPGGYSRLSALVTEVVMTMMFLLVILGATDKRAPQGMAPIAIGLCLTLIHLISIPVTNTSVNPARSTGVALFVGDNQKICHEFLYFFLLCLDPIQIKTYLPVFD